MAQKTEKEETEFKVPETISSCITTTTPPSTAATSSTTTSSPPPDPPQTTTATPPESSKPAGSSKPASPERTAEAETARSDNQQQEEEKSRSRPDVATEARRGISRCSGCKRKVGLTGFRCRCGDLFCWEHRYSDRHDCSYDYKAAGREAIARENPVVKAAKILKV